MGNFNCGLRIFAGRRPSLDNSRDGPGNLKWRSSGLKDLRDEPGNFRRESPKLTNSSGRLGNIAGRRAIS